MTSTENQTGDAFEGDGTGPETGMAEFVSFHLGDECFAFPMERVQEIIRRPATVAVPMTPPALIGLSNLRGVVLPIVDLRTTLGLPTIPADDASRVVVVHSGQAIGLVVDRVARVMTVPEERIEPTHTVEQAIGGEDLTGVVRDEDSGDLIQLLDPVRLLGRSFPEVEPDASTVLGAASASVQHRDEGADEDDESVQLVSFMLHGEEYAFPIEEVDEIVRVPARIASVPGTDPNVLGIISLRHRLLPLVCLRRTFALSQTEIGDSNRILVVRLAGNEDDDLRVGIVVDQVREVLRVPKDARDRPPGVLRRGDRQEIGAICQLDGGKRLVSVLSGAALFQLPALRNALEQADDAADLHDDIESEETMDHSETDEAQLVVYQLDGQEFGVDIHSVQEIIRVPPALSRVPRAPEAVEGIINLRGMVLPVLEMRRSFGLDAMGRNDRQRILVLNVAGTRTGYIVDSVAEVLRLPLSAMEPAPKLSREADRLVGRVANLDGGKRMVLVLDVAALIAEEELPADLGGALALELSA